MARRRDRNGKDEQQDRVIKDRDGNVIMSEENVFGTWKEYVREENRTDGGKLVS